MQDALYIAGGTQIVFCFFVSMALNYIVGAISVLQLNTFQSMVNVNMPSNAMTFVHTLANLLNVEIISPEFTTEKVMDTEPDYEFVEFINELRIDTVLSPQI